MPVALVGTYELLPMDTYHIKCRPLEMRVGEPISTAGLTLRDMEALSPRSAEGRRELYYGYLQDRPPSRHKTESAGDL